MKLFEYTALVSVNTVIAAETREEAEAKWKSLYNEADCGSCLVSENGLADVVCVSDGELLAVRDPSCYDSIEDEAHIVVTRHGLGGEW